MKKETKSDIPIMITEQMKLKLGGFGFSEEEISKLTPAEAWKTIREKEELQVALRETQETAERFKQIDEKGNAPDLTRTEEEDFDQSESSSLDSLLPADTEEVLSAPSEEKPEVETPVAREETPIVAYDLSKLREQTRKEIIRTRNVLGISLKRNPEDASAVREMDQLAKNPIAFFEKRLETLKRQSNVQRTQGLENVIKRDEEIIADLRNNIVADLENILGVPEGEEEDFTGEPDLGSLLPLETASVPETPEEKEVEEITKELAPEIKEKIDARKTPIDVAVSRAEQIATILAEEEVKNFIAEFNLESLLPPEFNELEEAQKLKVIRDLERRIVDIVKTDAQIQYSDSGDLKEKKNIKAIRSSIKKESAIKDIEHEIFEKIKDTEEGKKLIIENLGVLVEKTKKQNVVCEVENGRLSPFVIYIDLGSVDWKDCTIDEVVAVDRFNKATNAFAGMPYEWGQEQKKGSKLNPEIFKGHRGEYDRARREYDEAKEKVLEIKKEREKPEEKGKALTEVLEADNLLKLEQLLNTHPEFEKALDDFEKSAGGKEVAKTFGNFFQTITGGKNWTNKFLFAGGFGARMGVKAVSAASSMTLVGALGTSAVGGIIGWYRGKIRGKEILTERQKQARRGQGDESKEATNTVDAENLNERMETMIQAFEEASTPEEKAKRLDQIKRRIEYTQNKIEGGLVNFGNAKTSLSNQYNLINNLNNALVISAISEETTRKDIDARLDRFLAYKTGKIETTQAKFIRTQALKGAAYGAVFATLGYGVRWLGEHYGVWESIGKHMPWHHDEVSEVVTAAKTDIAPAEQHPEPTPVPPPTETVAPVPGENPPSAEPAPAPAPAPAETVTPPPVSAPATVPEPLATDAIVHKGEGIEHAFRRQIEHNADLARTLGFKGEAEDTEALRKFSGGAAHKLALGHGYVDSAGHEIRIAEADKIGYEIKLEDGKLVVNEKMADGTIMETRHPGEAFEQETEQYEYKKEPVSVEKLKADIAEKISATETAPPAEESAFKQKLIINEKITPQHLTPTTEELKNLENQRIVDEMHAQALREQTLEKMNESPEWTKNPFHLSEEKLTQTYEAGQKNIKLLFGEQSLDVWKNLEDIKVSKIIEQANDGSASGRLAGYLRMLRNSTELKPKSGFLGLNPESAGHYVARALQKLTVEGKLETFQESLRK